MTQNLNFQTKLAFSEKQKFSATFFCFNHRSLCKFSYMMQNSNVTLCSYLVKLLYLVTRSFGSNPFHISLLSYFYPFQKYCEVELIGLRELRREKTLHDGCYMHINYICIILYIYIYTTYHILYITYIALI